MNTQKTTHKIIRLDEAKNILGLSKSSFYNRIKEGALPSAINLGGRAVGWVEQEISAILNAMIAGKSQSDVKALVVELTNKRQELV